MEPLPSKHRGGAKGIGSVGLMVCVLGTTAMAAGCRARQDSGPHTYPADLVVRGTAGSLVPGDENQLVEIRADGRGRFARFDPGEPGPPLEDIEFDVGGDQLETLWTVIGESEFFSLDPSHEAPSVDDGVLSVLAVTAEGRTHEVEVRNVSLPPFEEILRAINRITPDGKDLHYAGPNPEG